MFISSWHELLFDTLPSIRKNSCSKSLYHALVRHVQPLESLCFCSSRQQQKVTERRPEGSYWKEKQQLLFHSFSKPQYMNLCTLANLSTKKCIIFCIVEKIPKSKIRISPRTDIRSNTERSPSFNCINMNFQLVFEWHPVMIMRINRQEHVIDTLTSSLSSWQWQWEQLLWYNALPAVSYLIINHAQMAMLLLIQTFPFMKFVWQPTAVGWAQEAAGAIPVVTSFDGFEI